MTPARLDGSIKEWTPYAVAGGHKFIFRRSNGDIFASVGAQQEVQTQRDKGLFRFDAKAECFVPVSGDGPRSGTVKPMSEMPRKY